MSEAVEHPSHYGGDVPTEPIKVIRAWGVGFALGNAVKYIARAGKKGGPAKKVEDLSKAIFYIQDEITRGEDAEAEPFVGIPKREIDIIRTGLHAGEHEPQKLSAAEKVLDELELDLEHGL